MDRPSWAIYEEPRQAMYINSACGRDEDRDEVCKSMEGRKIEQLWHVNKTN